MGKIAMKCKNVNDDKVARSLKTFSRMEVNGDIRMSPFAYD